MRDGMVHIFLYIYTSRNILRIYGNFSGLFIVAKMRSYVIFGTRRRAISLQQSNGLIMVKNESLSLESEGKLINLYVLETFCFASEIDTTVYIVGSLSQLMKNRAKKIHKTQRRIPGRVLT